MSREEDSALWQAGQGCPVVGCQPNDKVHRFRDISQFKTHWLEKHEAIIPLYLCSLCRSSFKRKSNLYQHFRMKHGQPIEYAVGRVENRANLEFLDPGPLTLNHLLGTY